MTRRSRFFSGIAFTLVIAACGSAADPLGPDGGPSLNGGLVTGSNREGTDSTSTGTTSTETPPPPPDSTSRGGGLVTGSN